MSRRRCPAPQAPGFFFLLTRRPPGSTLFPYTTLFRSGAFQFLEKPLTPEGVLTTLRAALELSRTLAENRRLHEALGHSDPLVGVSGAMQELRDQIARDRKSTRLNSSHSQISYAVFCLK